MQVTNSIEFVDCWVDKIYQKSIVEALFVRSEQIKFKKSDNSIYFILNYKVYLKS